MKTIEGRMRMRRKDFVKELKDAEAAVENKTPPLAFRAKCCIDEYEIYFV